MTTQSLGVAVQQDDAPRRPGRPARPVTRDHLLRVAREAFSELGYAGASMGDIAGRAGIRKSSLFHHFATKDELYRDALAGVLQDVGRQVQDAIQATGPILERMDQAALAVQRYLGSNPVAARLLIREFVDGSAAVTSTGEALDGVLKMACDLLEAAMNEGAIPRQDARHLAMSIGGAHLLFFAMPDVSSRLVGGDIYGPELVEVRAQAVRLQTRRLIGAPVV
jgi:AcrR family transcriptional regulator